MKTSSVSPLVALLVLMPLVWSTGCGSDKKEADPKQLEQIRKQYIDRAERMRREG